MAIGDGDEDDDDDDLEEIDTVKMSRRGKGGARWAARPLRSAWR